MSVAELGLIGDIGATNARFALVGPEGATTAARVYALDDYPSLPEAIGAYLEEESPLKKPDQAVLAVASPITGDQVTFTNHSLDILDRGCAQALRIEAASSDQRFRR